MKLPDNLFFGFLFGLLAPFAAFFVFWLFAFQEYSFIDALNYYKSNNVLTHVLSLCAIINLPIFFLFLNKVKEKSAYGIIGATFIYAFAVLIYRLI